MTTEQPYTPSEADAREGYITGMIRDGDGADWDEYREGAGDDFDRFVAQVRCDAAAEALRAHAEEMSARAIQEERASNWDGLGAFQVAAEQAEKRANELEDVTP